MKKTKKLPQNYTYYIMKERMEDARCSFVLFLFPIDHTTTYDDDYDMMMIMPEFLAKME